MAKEKDSPSQHENSGRASKFAYTFCLVSVFICAAVLVRVEIVNQRVYAVENSLAEIRKQNADKNSHVSGESFKQEKREKYNIGLNLNDENVRDLVTGKYDLKKYVEKSVSMKCRL